ncbi:MAG: hypothetical protein WB947_08060 [Thermoplasmata archaeon]
MTTVRTVAAHEVVRAAYPREVTERDEIGMAVGKAIDETLSHFSHEVHESRRPTFSAMQRMAESVLDRELVDADVQLDPAARTRELAEVIGVLQAFRRSEIMGMSRPRSRMILINEAVGVYAQPDFWDGRDRFFEMKSYHAVATPPDVVLQLQLFECAFPGFHAFLACFDRHATPVTTSIEPVPPLDPPTTEEVLRRAYRTGIEKGSPKVLEYIDAPTVRYTVPV